MLMHANEALNARAELKNTGVTSSLTSLWEPELHLWGSALKVAQRVGCHWRCYLKIHALTQTPCPVQLLPPRAKTPTESSKKCPAKMSSENKG